MTLASRSKKLSLVQGNISWFAQYFGRGAQNWFDVFIVRYTK